jgi:hypothetical protein
MPYFALYRKKKNKYRVIIDRCTQDENQTLGTCTIINEDGKPVFTAISLERGTSDPKCVPEGVYKCVYEYSPGFKRMLWELKDVPDRSECKFHVANFFTQLKGCIALGFTLGDINNDGYNDVLQSGSAMDAFHKALKSLKEIEVEIKWAA